MAEKGLTIAAAVVLAAAALTSAWAATQVENTKTVKFLRGSSVVYAAGSVFSVYKATQEET